MDSRISEFLRNPWTIPSAVGVVAFGGGLTVGYFLGKRKTNTEPEEEQLTFTFGATTDDISVGQVFDVHNDTVRPEEIEVYAPATLESISTDDPRPNPSDITVDEVVMERVEAIKEDGGRVTIDDYVPETENIFAGNTDGWDYTEEVKARDSSKPYILHRDEFFAEEMGFSQNTLTYYEGDDIMSDDGDMPVYNYARLLGELRFGHGSLDPNVVYIRNEKRKCEYEVLYDPGMFSKEVLGIHAEDASEEDEIRHGRNLTKFKLE